MDGMTDKLADLLLRWEEAWAHGEDVSASQLCEDHPDLLDDLQAKIDDLKKMAWMTKDGEDRATDETDDLISKTLGGRYRIESLIASGGFGRVYRAFDPDLERHVAVKVPNKRRLGANGDVDTLVEEARRVAKLRHPGIVAVHDVGTDDGKCFIVSDLIEGRNLSDAIADGRPSVRESVLLVASVAENLQAAHDEGFIYRDIKPSNILIDRSGKPLLTDFGIATTADSDMSDAAPTSGTLPYMSPEQIAGEAQLIDARSDICSLGVVLYESLTGHSPYQARTPGTLREQILFRSPIAMNISVPKPIEAVCMKCLAKHPADRFASATDLASALRNSLTERTTSSSWKWLLLVAGVIAVTAVAFAVGRQIGQQTATKVVAATDEETAFVFDGNSRIVTPLERFAPVTLEAWVRPDRFNFEGCHFVIGSDMPGQFGIGIGMCPTQLSAEYIAGDVSVSSHSVPIRTWSHIAATFGETETRLYLDGNHVHTAPPTENKGGTKFVIGNVGDTNHIAFFMGKIRSLRITRGERYHEDFTPDVHFKADDDAVLLYDGSKTDGDKVLDLSGHENHGTWQRFTP